jgi:ribonuclease T1
MIHRFFLALILLSLCGCGQSRTEAPGRGGSATPTAGLPAGSGNGQRIQADDGQSIAESRLPPEARRVIEAIRRGGPFFYKQDGTVFGNRERLLPAKPRGYYLEYTVRTPGAGNRGARRIVAGAGGELYYSDDHYNSFRRIREEK